MCVSIEKVWQTQFGVSSLLRCTNPVYLVECKYIKYNIYVPIVQVTEAPAAAAKCEDLDPSCAAWAKNGECTKNPYWMKPNCGKSCDFCGSIEEVNAPSAVDGQLFAMFLIIQATVTGQNPLSQLSSYITMNWLKRIDCIVLIIMSWSHRLHGFQPPVRLLGIAGWMWEERTVDECELQTELCRLLSEKLNFNVIFWSFLLCDHNIMSKLWASFTEPLVHYLYCENFALNIVSELVFV